MNFSLQVYLPQQLYVLKNNKNGQPMVDRDFVLVESGCQCLSSSATSALAATSTLGVDEAVKASLLMATGIDLENDYLALLASITPPVNPSPASTATSTSPIDLDGGFDKGTDVPYTGSTYDWISDSTSSTAPSAAPSAGTLQLSHAFVDGANQVSVATFYGSSETPSVLTMSVVMESVTESVPLLKDLPHAAGSPVYIPEGFFDPVLQAIRPFLP